MKLTELTPDSSNANKGTQRGRRELETSLRAHGWVEAGVLDKHNRIVGGNKRQEVAVDIGLPDDAIIVDHDGSRPIFVRLTGVDLDTPEGRLLAYRLNRVAQLNIDFDAEQIALDLDTGLDLSGLWENWEFDGLTPFGETSTDRDRQGVSSTWDAVKSAAAGKVIIDDIETRLPNDVIQLLKDTLLSEFEQHNRPIHETLEVIIVSGVRAFEISGD